MKPYVLARKSTNGTARILARHFGMEKSYTPREYKPSIRWGNSENAFLDDTDLNNPKLVRISANKLSLYRHLEGKVNIVPIKSGIPDKFPVLIRGTLTGSQGAGCHVCTSEAEFMSLYQGNYWAPWYSFKYELGVHVVGGSIKKIFKKVWSGEGDEPEHPIKNASRGFHFSLVNMESFISGQTFKALIPFVDGIYEHFPLNMGRFDIGFSPEFGYTLIEVNSAPSLKDNESTLKIYIDYLEKSL